MRILEGEHRPFLERAALLAEFVKDSEDIHIVTHIDADGITSGAIAYETCIRMDKTTTIEFVKQLDDTIIKRLEHEDHGLIWFTDLGSSFSTSTPTLNKIITDHHECPNNSDLSFHLNPHLFGRDGSYDISGAGCAYLVARAIDIRNRDLASLAIVGAIGDLQGRRCCKLTGTNRYLIEEGIAAGVVNEKMDIRYFGRETRPVSKLLQYANDPLIPGLTGRESACTAFLNDIGIRLKDGNNNWRAWVDFSDVDRKIMISAVIKRLLSKGFGHKTTLRAIGNIYELSKEERGTELHDAKEFATLLNSTARYGQYDVGLNICRGDRDEWLKKGRNLLKGHRANLVEGLHYAKEQGITKNRHVQYFHAQYGIRDTIVGIVTNMLLNSEEIDPNMPLIGFAYTEDGSVKASARATQSLVDKGLDLSVIMKKASLVLEGAGGGHNIAAGATIPSGKEKEFIKIVEEEISLQLHTDD